MTSVTLSADIPQEVPFTAVSPCTSPAAWNYAIPDSLGVSSSPPADITEFEFPAKSGQRGAFNVRAAVAAARSNCTVAPYLEAYVGSTSYRWAYPQYAISSSGTNLSIEFPEFPDGTSSARVGLELREPAAGTILRTNLYTDPRCTSLTAWSARNSWVLTAGTAASDLGIQTGLKTYVQAACNSAATGTLRGLTFYQDTSSTNPTASLGFPVTAGDTITISGYMLTTKAGSVRVTVRFFSGTTWTAALTDSTLVAATANTWTRVSLTVTVPAGATLMCGRFVVNDSIAWTTADYVRVSGVLIEKAGAVAAYFDGKTADTSTIAYHWRGTANASVSESYDVTALPTVVRTNLIANPSFETNTTGWQSAISYFAPAGTTYPTTSLTRVSGGIAGSQYGRVTLVAANDYNVASVALLASSRLALIAGETYTLSAWLRASAGSQVRLSATHFDASTGSNFSGSFPRSYTSATYDWQRVSLTFTVPTGYVYTSFSISSDASTSSLPTGSYLDVDAIMLEKTATVNEYFDGSTNPSTDYLVRWTGTAGASTSEMYVSSATPAEPGRSIILSNASMYVEVDAEEIIAAPLKRSLRRSVFDALNEAAPQISVGTPGLLAGSITYLCESLEQALALDNVYQKAGMCTLTTGPGVPLDGFKHMAVDTINYNIEKALPGYAPKWTVQVEVREIAE